MRRATSTDASLSGTSGAVVPTNRQRGNYFLHIHFGSVTNPVQRADCKINDVSCVGGMDPAIHSIRRGGLRRRCGGPRQLANGAQLSQQVSLKRTAGLAGTILLESTYRRMTGQWTPNFPRSPHSSITWSRSITWVRQPSYQGPTWPRAAAFDIKCAPAV